MDEDSNRMVEDCFLRPLSDARTTNAHLKKAAPAPQKHKAELQMLFLSEESQKRTMDTLRFIHGDDFRLDDASKYVDRGNQKKNNYWQERGTLIVRGVTDYSRPAANSAGVGGNSNKTGDETEEHLRRYALVKLENYGFPLAHCIEAYDHCEGSIDAALYLLFRKYMRIENETNATMAASALSEQELLDLREDEKQALESIYDKAFEEKEKNAVWSLKFQVEHLLAHSPSQMKKAIAAAAEATQAAKAALANKKKDKSAAKQQCHNFVRDGTCKFGNKCRFAHVRSAPAAAMELTPGKVKLSQDEHDKWFYLEVRFPPNSKYPYEAPFTYLKTTCHDIPREMLLLLSRSLYLEAKEICQYGMACVYSICELLQSEEEMNRALTRSAAPFPSAHKSLFYVAEQLENLTNGHAAKQLPTHYEKGQTASGDNKVRSSDQLERENRILLRKFLDNQRNEHYKKMIAQRQTLPAFSKMDEILQIVQQSQVVVISGETGCGKSTQVPQFLLDNWLFQSTQLQQQQKMPHCEIICTQPRRLSAIGVAERVSDERAERVGQTVGYQIRLENKISSSTRLTFCTTGILLRRLASDPLLNNVTHILVDEVHERSEESDFLLVILREILRKRNDLKVLLMSATLNAKLFSDYFGGVPVLDIPGRTFPVEQLFLEDILEVCDFVMECDSQYCRKIKRKEEEELMRELEYADVKAECVAPTRSIKDENLTLAQIYGRYMDYSKKTCKSIYLIEPMKINPELIESVLKYIVEGEHDWPREGSIVIFLPGLQEIQAVHDALSDSVLFGPRANKFVLVPLHSTLSSEEQAAVFRPAPKGKRKIVLSTNIAETSVTIDDCVFVIDYGLMKEKHFDANRNMESLDLVWVSRANAMQRKGRAGRVMPGICIHLYTGHRYRYHILSQPVPEIHRVPLEQLVLRIKTLPNFAEQNVLEVLGQTLEPPTEDSIVSAIQRLQDVGALDNDQSLTPLGHHLSALPVDVRIGKLMLFGAIFQCLDSVLTIAACLSHKTPFVSPFNKRVEAERRKREFSICNSDHLTCLLAYKKWLDVNKRNFYAGRNYADEHFLSLKTLQTIAEVKYQFLELLVSIGFVPVNVPRKRKNGNDNVFELTGNELNLNGENNRLLISLLCAALYPNVVKILMPERTYIQTPGGAMPKELTAKDLRFKTREDGFVAIHPSSVNANIANFKSPYLLYQEKVKTSSIFIRECSMLPLVPLVLFAGSDLRVELHDGEFLFSLENGWIMLKAHNHQTAEMIQCLRIELLKLLEEKIRDPCLNLLNHANGCRIIENIVYLISNNN